MRIVVLGGTGFLGAGIARALVETGHAVAVNGHGNKVRPAIDEAELTRTHVDDRDIAQLPGLLDGFDIIVDAATPYPVARFDPASRPAPVHALAVARARAIAETVRRADAVLIHISSFTTAPTSGGVVAQLTQGVLRASHPYFELKAAVERVIIAAQARGLSAAILRVPACLGPFDMKPRDQCFVPQLIDGALPAISRKTINVIDPRDLGQIIAGLIDQKQVSDVLPIAGHNIAIDNLAGEICRLADVRPPGIHMPALVGAAGLHWLETGLGLTGQRSPWPSLPLLLLSAGGELQPTPCQLSVGVELRSLCETLGDAIAWYRRIGYLSGPVG